MITGIFAISQTQVGSTADPFISLSYLNEFYEEFVDSYSFSMENELIARNDSVSEYEVTYSDILDVDYEEEITLVRGDILTMPAGGNFVIKGGMVTTSGTNKIINVTRGTEVPAGYELSLYNRYMFTELDGASITVTTNGCSLSVEGEYTITYAHNNQYLAYASALNKLGLFNGTTYGFELGRVSNREEGLIMFIRILGEETEALSYTGTHPYTDVPSWYDSYVSYGYNMGYTKGISDTKFGAGNEMTAVQYFIYLMRALGYDDGTDFVWDQSLSFAQSLNFMDYDYIENLKNDEKLYRDDIVYISYNLIMNGKIRDTNQLVVDKLLDDGVFTEDMLAQAEKIISNQ